MSGLTGITSLPCRKKYQQFLVPQSENFLSRFKTLEVSGLLQLVYLGEISIDKTSESELRKMIGQMDSVFEFLPIFSPNYKIFGKFFFQSWSSVDQRKVAIETFFSEDEGHADLKKLNAEFVNEDLAKFTRETLITKIRHQGIVTQLLLKRTLQNLRFRKYY